jgi:hypothetical protein
MDQQPLIGFIGITGKTCGWDPVAARVQITDVPVIFAGGIHLETGLTAL